MLAITLSLILSTLPFLGSVDVNSSNLDDGHVYLHVDYNCSNPDPHVIRENASAKYIYVEFSNCRNMPEELFAHPNNIQKLILSVATASNYNFITDFTNRIFTGLESLRALEMHGFEDITEVSERVFSPLRNINYLYLNGFGKSSLRLPFNALGILLRGLSNSSIEKIVMNEVRTRRHHDKRLKLAEVFNIENVKITSLIVENTFIMTLIGSFTDILPALTTLSLSLSINSDIGFVSVIDSIFLQNIQFVRVYNYNDNLMIFNLYETNLIKFLMDIFFRHSVSLPTFDFNCALNVRTQFSKSVTAVVANGIQLTNYTGASSEVDNRPACFHESNRLRILDLSECQLEESLRVFSGLKRLIVLNVQNTRIIRISPQQLEELPQLEYFLLGYNNLRDCIASDYDSTLFKSGQNLISLDLAHCNLVNIPYYEFRPLVSLRYLNLSGNAISNIELHISNCIQLQLLNLSNNRIEKLSAQFIKMLEATVEQNANATSLEIDLSGNPLSCLCDAIDFLTWIQSPNKITFTMRDSYECLYPNGSRLNLMSVHVEELTRQCGSIENLKNNTACPCDRNELENLYNIRYSLVGYRCSYFDGMWIEMNELEINMTINSCSHLPMKISIIAPIVATTGVLLIIIVAITFVGIVRYKRKKPEDADRILRLFSTGKLISALMALLFENRASNLSTEFSYDVLVFYHESERCRVLEEIVNELIEMDIRIKTEEDTDYGDIRIVRVLEYISECRSILLVITPDFVEDNFCRDVTIRTIEKQHAVIPLVFVPFELNDNDNIFKSLIATGRPIDWPRDACNKEVILTKLKSRILDEIKIQIDELLEPSSNTADENTPLLG